MSRDVPAEKTRTKASLIEKVGGQTGRQLSSSREPAGSGSGAGAGGKGGELSLDFWRVALRALEAGVGIADATEFLESVATTPAKVFVKRHLVLRNVGELFGGKPSSALCAPRKE